MHMDIGMSCCSIAFTWWGVGIHNMLCVAVMHVISSLPGTVTLPKILSFFTGADVVPALGFPHDPTLPTTSTQVHRHVLLNSLYQHSTHLIQISQKVVAYSILNRGGFRLH